MTWNRLARRQVVFTIFIPTDSAVLHRRFRAKIKGVFPNGIGQAWQGVLACCPQIPGRKQWNGHYASQQGSPHAGLSKTTPPRLMKHSGYTLTVGFRPRVSSLAAQSCNRYIPATAWLQPVSLVLSLLEGYVVNELLQCSEYHRWQRGDTDITVTLSSFSACTEVQELRVSAPMCKARTIKASGVASQQFSWLLFWDCPVSRCKV